MKLANLQMLHMACQPTFSQLCINPSSLMLEFNFLQVKGNIHTRTGHEGLEGGAEI
jgi:hypothetical protein